MPGFEYKDICYTTTAQAADAFFAAQTPFYQSANGDLTQFKHIPVDGLWKLHKSTTDTLGNTTTQYLVDAQYPTFRSCELQNDATANFMDGMTMGWGVAAAMIAVYVIRRPYR